MLGLVWNGLLAARVLTGIMIVGCGNTSDENQTIKMTKDSLDIRITESSPTESIAGDHENTIGFDDTGEESRLLLYLPKMNQIYDKNYLKSGITSVVVRLNVQDVLANPESIELYPIASPWSPYATWKSRFGAHQRFAWVDPGGDTIAGLNATTPSIRRNTNDPYLFELNFDITERVSDILQATDQSYGFLIRLQKSNLNGENRVVLMSSNHPNNNSLPSASLEFAKSTTQGEP